MAIKQYIGARYVPKFYQGSNGNEWDSGVTYEALTMVTYLSNTYCSKKPVPARTITPNNDTEYWVLTAAYSSQVADLREELENFEEETENTFRTINGTLEDIGNKLNDFVTPEQFGAKGDGIEDDTEAFESCIASNKIIIATNTYKITQPLSCNNTNLYCYGKIIYTGADACINVTDRYSNIYVKYAEGDSTNIFIKLNSFAETNNIIVGEVKNFATAIYLYATNNSGVQYNNIKFEYIKNCTNGIYGFIQTLGWINSNYFTGGRIGANVGYGIKLDCTDEGNEFNGNIFNNIGLEGITQRAIQMKQAFANYFNDIRLTESFSGDYKIYMNYCYSNHFSGKITIAIPEIYDANTIPTLTLPYIYYNEYTCERIERTVNGSWIGSKMRSINNTYLIQDNVNSAFVPRADQVDVDMTAPGTIVNDMQHIVTGNNHLLKLPYFIGGGLNNLIIQALSTTRLQYANGTNIDVTNLAVGYNMLRYTDEGFRIITSTKLGA